MIDVQNSLDTREVPLEKVGVKNVKYPVCVLDKKNKFQNTNALVNLFVNLPHNFKGTHMSRFIAVFHKYHKNLSMSHFLDMLEEIRQVLDAEKSYASIEFPYFICKEAPVTKSEGIMQYTCSYEGQVSKKSDGSLEKKFFVTVSVPVTTLCPCSKAISQYGAHNQRGTVKVRILYSDFFWIEDVIKLIEDSASSPLYTLLKRQDEKFVTESAYENPRFVEDLVREVYIGLKNFNVEKKFKYFSVEAETEESIHNHNAYAFTSYDESLEK